MTDEQKTKAVEWLTQHLKGCPVCGDADWTMVDLVTTASYGDVLTSLFNVAPKYPLLLVTCDACGYVMQFSAFVIGLLEE